MVTDETLLAAEAVRDYRHGTTLLREAIECRLAHALPPGTTEIALWDVDAVTPVAIAAARRLQLHVCAVYVSDERYEGDTLAGVPLVHVQHVTTQSAPVTVVTRCTPASMAAADLKVAPDRLIALTEPSPDLDDEPPEPAMITQLAEARLLRDQGRVEEALAVYQLQTLRADAASTLRHVADLAFELGRWMTALRLYRRLLRRYPEDAPQVTYRIASAYKQLGRQDRARYWFARVLAASDAAPRLKAGSHFHLGGLCVEQRDISGAAAHLREAVRLMPDHGDARALLEKLAA